MSPIKIESFQWKTMERRDAKATLISYFYDDITWGDIRSIYNDLTKL
jgi:hypothetical protein